MLLETDVRLFCFSELQISSKAYFNSANIYWPLTVGGMTTYHTEGRCCRLGDIVAAAFGKYNQPQIG